MADPRDSNLEGPDVESKMIDSDRDASLAILVDGATPASRADDNKIASFFRSFFDLFRLPAGFWIVNIAYAFDGFAYFGILVLMNLYFTRDVGIPDKWATVLTGTFAMGVTLFMFGAGSFSERFGIRKSMLASFLILTLGRAVLCMAPLLASHGLGIAMICLSLVIMAIGEGVLQTANYSGLKQYSDEKSSAMGFGFNYAIFNAGIVVVGFASPPIRTGVETLLSSGADRAAHHPLLSWLLPISRSGVGAVFWVCTLSTLLSFLFCWLTLTRSVESRKLRPESEERIAAQRRADSQLSLWDRIRSGPFSNARFTFFVFALFPARTLFAHQIHTISIYIARAYPKNVQDKNEWFSNVINPLIIVLGVPVITGFVRNVKILNLMLIGTLVTAIPTFLLCFGERWDLLLVYTVLFSIGEALWQPRFYQFAADLAPEGKMGSYMAAANIPWLLAKFIVGLYAGLMLSRYCPEVGPKRPGVMWAIYGVTALASPIALWAARDWLREGLQKQGPVAGFPVQVVEPKSD